MFTVGATIENLCTVEEKINFLETEQNFYKWDFEIGVLKQFDATFRVPILFSENRTTLLYSRGCRFIKFAYIKN